jgi:uridine phosphorylase
MDLMIESFNFRVGSLGSIRLVDPMNSGPSAEKTAIVATSGTSVGSSSEVNSPVSIKPMKSKGNTVGELDKIMENLNLDESSGYSDMASEGNFKNISSYFKKDFIARYGNVSDNSVDTWRLGLGLHDDERTIFSSGSSHGANNRHQVCVIINDTSKEFDAENNPVINPQNLDQGAKHRAEGET